MWVLESQSVCPFCLPAPFNPLNIFNLSYERVEHLPLSMCSQQRHLNDPVEILSVTSLLQSCLHSHKIWPEMENCSNAVVACSFCVVRSWLQQAIK